MADVLVSSEVEPFAYALLSPSVLTSPVVFASPHSGRYYPPEFVASSRLDAETLRRSEDGYVDALFVTVPTHGAPLIAAHYARAYCDLNREPFELDPAMFSDPLPPRANIRSPRVAAGLGTIARTVGAGVEIYSSKLRVAEVERRLSRCYYPYHQQLERLVKQTRDQFGWSLLVDCHSMPSAGATVWRDAPIDVVLGDSHGLACSSKITDLIEEFLAGRGYSVERNTPYAGGYTTCHYGHPALGSHSIQIEINRSLYLDEKNLVPGPGFDRVATDMDLLVGHLTTHAAQWQGNTL